MPKPAKKVRNQVAFTCPECRHSFARKVGSLNKKTSCPKCGCNFERRANVTGDWDGVRKFRPPKKAKPKKRSGIPKCFLPPEFSDADKGMLADRQAAQHKITGKRNDGAGNFKRKTDDDFCRSMKWRQLRYLALKNTEGRCQCCGATAADGLQLHVDHIQPRSKRPDLSLSLDNLQVLCSDCNVGKGSWDESNWRDHWQSI